MDLLLAILLGFIMSAIGTSLPGLLNMTAAKVGLRDGRKRGVIFSLGATTVVFFQTYIAVSFAIFINSNPDIIDLLQEIGLAIFTILTIYFLFIAKKPVTKEAEETVNVKSKTGRFFLGALLSALNFFPIPFYVFSSITLSTYGYFHLDDHLFIFLFVLGVMVGSFTIFYLYILFFKNSHGNTDFFMRNINYIIGSITGVISIITLFRVINNL
ncbi:MAG: lysine transporter LysE [Flavobacterium sp.]|nr:MAG: lysine transporter LysE [Flavobacterium sp.]